MKYKFSYLTKIVKIKIVTKIKNSYREEGHKVGRESFINEIPPSSAAYVRHDMWDVKEGKKVRWMVRQDYRSTGGGGKGDKEWWNWVKLCKLVKTQVKRGGGQQRCEKKRRGGGTDCFQLPPPKVHITHLPTSTTYDKQGCENCSGSRQLSWCAIQFDK